MKSDDERLYELVNTKQGKENVTDWMKKDWDERASVDAMYFVRSVFNQTEKDFWDDENRPQVSKILGGEPSRFNKIIKDKDPKKMRVLEIGCGVGRVLVSMSKTFGEIIGVDISNKMIYNARKNLKSHPNCKVYENNGLDLSLFPENHFDFCYSVITFQHVPKKEIVLNYVKEVARVLKPFCIFRFQIHGDTDFKPPEFNTWYGVHFTSNEMHQMANDNNFEILEESGQKDQYYWLTFKKKNR